MPPRSPGGSTIGRNGRPQLLRLCEQQVEQVSGRSERRFDPSGEEQPQEGEDLVVAEPFAVQLGVGEPADQVLLRRSRRSARMPPMYSSTSRDAAMASSCLARKLRMAIDHRWNCM